MARPAEGEPAARLGGQTKSSCAEVGVMPRYNRFILRHAIDDTMSANKTWMCLICGWIYDEATGAPDDGIAPGTPWEDVPMNWTCPECGARKEDFEMVQL